MTDWGGRHPIAIGHLNNSDDLKKPNTNERKQMKEKIMFLI